MPWPKIIKYYLHQDKDTNWDCAKELDLGENASHTFSYTCSELELTLKVFENGTAVITHVQGIELPVETLA